MKFFSPFSSIRLEGQLCDCVESASPSVLLEELLTQVSDILQYLGGNLVGRTRIGSINPKKTYEGYLISLTLILTGGLVNNSIYLPGFFAYFLQR